MEKLVTEKLLLCLSKNVVFPSLKDFSVELLDIPYARFTQIEAKSTDPGDKIFELLLEWHHKGPRTTRDLLNVTAEAITNGYVARNCFNDLCGQAHIDTKQQDVTEICDKLQHCRVQEQVQLSSPSIPLTHSRQDIRKLTEQSFKSPPFSLALQSEWLSTPRTVKLKDIYTNLRWVHIHRKPCDVLKQDIDGYWQMLVDKELGDGPVRILVEGKAGIGKTTFVHLLAIEWATRVRSELSHFDLVFTLPLRDVRPHHKLEELIVNCHRRLKYNKVQHKDIAEILNEEDGQKILIVLDGYDEYTPGTNAEIDDALEKLSLWDCWIIITSRPSDKLNKLRQYIDAEARILGFTEENVLTYASKFLGNEGEAKKLVAKAKARDMMDILTIPIMLQMVCELYASGKDLPQTKMDIMQSIFDFCFERAAQKTGRTWSDDERDEVLYRLGQLSWEALGKETRQLILNKREVIALVGDAILETGLLLVTEDNDSFDPDDNGLTFQHKMLQEYAASYFLDKRHRGQIPELKLLFPTLRSIVDHNIVLQFLCGHSEAMSEVVMELCSQVVAKSFADNLGKAQSVFAVDWLIDERAYLTGINKIVPPHIILSWSDAVGIYLQTIFETIAAIHRECRRAANVKSFDSKDLWVLSPDAWSLPCDPPKDQKLVIVHHLDEASASTHMSLVGETQYQGISDQFCDEHGDGNLRQSVMLVNPAEEYTSVVPCMTRVVASLNMLSTVFLCRLFYQEVSNGEIAAVLELSRSLFRRENLQHIIVLKSKLPEVFYSEMFMGIMNNGDLQKLDIYFCEIPPAAARLIPDALPYLSNLTSLTLRQCNFNFSDSEMICKEIFHLVSLQHLDLCLNPNIGQCADILAETFTKWQGHPLEEIYVRECHIPGDKGKAFLKAVTNLPYMRKMGLAYNNLQGALPGLMRKPPPLEELYIWKTGIETEDVMSLAAAVQAHKLPNLRRLHIERNSLTDKQVEPLLAQLNANHGTEILLDVSNNNLTKEFITHWSSITKRQLNVCWYLD